MEATITRLALNSLSLLGFKAEKYYSEHPQLRCPPMDANSFDKENEKALLLALHFLLSQLNPDFEVSVSYTWPYYDARGKNDFKIAVQNQLDELASVGSIPTECCKASILSMAKGFIVWQLLWKVSNAVFRYFEVAGGYHIAEHFPSEFNEINELQSLLKNEHANMLTENIAVVQRQREQYAYADDLYSRFKKAKKNIDKLQRDITALEVGEDTGPMLADSAPIKRTELTMNIESACLVLRRIMGASWLNKFRSLKNDGVSVFPRSQGISSQFTSEYLAALNGKILSDSSDRHLYTIIDKNDINELLDILIDKLENSNSLVRGMPGSDFKSSPLRIQNTNEDEKMLNDVLSIPSSVQRIQEGVRMISVKLKGL